MRKWWVLLALVAVGVSLFVMALRLVNEQDAIALAAPLPHGQFTGSGREFLLVFLWLALAASGAFAALLFAVVAVAKAVGRRFNRVRWLDLVFWSLAAPLTVGFVAYSIWSVVVLLSEAQRVS